MSNGTHAITDDVRNALAMVAAKTVHSDHEPVATEPTAAETAPVTDVAPHEDPTPADVPVEILDIPVAKKERAPRRARAAEADELLGSVLEALPEPQQPG